MDGKKITLTGKTNQEIASFSKYKYVKLHGPEKKDDNKNPFKEKLEKLKEAIQRGNRPKPQNKNTINGIEEIVRTKIFEVIKGGKSEEEALKYAMDNFDKYSNDQSPLNESATDSGNDVGNSAKNILGTSSEQFKNFDYKKALENIGNFDFMKNYKDFMSPLSGASSYSQAPDSKKTENLNLPVQDVDHAKAKKEWYARNGESIGMFYAAFTVLGLMFGALFGYIYSYSLLSTSIGAIIGLGIGIGLGLLANALLVTFKK